MRSVIFQTRAHAPLSAEDSERTKHEGSDDKKMSQQIAIMKPILRFLQLLCENHNRDLQVSDEIFVFTVKCRVCISHHPSEQCKTQHALLR